MKKQKNVLIIVANGFEDVELFAVNDVLKRNKINVDIFHTTNNKHVTSLSGIKVSINKLNDLSKISLNKYDALYIPGGGLGVDNLEKSKLFIDILKDFVENNKIIGALCKAPIILAKHGFLKGRKAICFPNEEFFKILEKNEVNLVSKKCQFNDGCSVVIDDNFITGLDYKTSIKFSEIFSKELNNK